MYMNKMHDRAFCRKTSCNQHNNQCCKTRRKKLYNIIQYILHVLAQFQQQTASLLCSAISIQFSIYIILSSYPRKFRSFLQNTDRTDEKIKLYYTHSQIKSCRWQPCTN